MDHKHRMQLSIIQSGNALMHICETINFGAFNFHLGLFAPSPRSDTKLQLHVPHMMRLLRTVELDVVGNLHVKADTCWPSKLQRMTDCISCTIVSGF